MLFAAEIAKYLGSAGLGVWSGVGSAETTIFLSVLPIEPDDCIAVRATGGPPTEDPRQPFDKPTIQIIVRGLAEPDTGNRAQAIFNALQGLAGIALDESHLVLCQGLASAPAYLEYTETGHHIYSMNFLAEVRTSGRD